MKRLSCVVAVALAAALSASAAGLETQKRVPDGCIAVITVSNIQSDPGISWMMNAWLTSQRKSPLKDLLKVAPPQEMSVAFFPETRDAPMYLLAVMAVPNADGIDKAALAGVIKESAETKIETVVSKGATVAYKAGPKTSSDFGAYAVMKDQIMFGSDLAVITKALDGPSVAGSPAYQRVGGQLGQTRDALLFADNSGSRFAKFLAPREKKWKMSLLMSAEYLQYLGSSFDIVDSSKATGSFVFQAADKGHIDDIRDDAEFLGEAFKRKFIAEKIQYTGKVDVKEATVTLSFQLGGLEPLWKKLFDQGVLDLFRPES